MNWYILILILNLILSSGFTSEQPLISVSSSCLRSCLFVSGVNNPVFLMYQFPSFYFNPPNVNTHIYSRIQCVFFLSHLKVVIK